MAVVDSGGLVGNRDYVATGQVTVATTATLIVPARPGRLSVTIIQEGTTVVRLGNSGVTTGNGVPLPGTANSSFTIDGGAAVYGIVGAGTQLVSFIENF
jgi:hypothetical protein